MKSFKLIHLINMGKVLAILIILIANKSFAHPVGYTDSATLGLMQRGSMYSYQLHYSPSYRYSFGYKEASMMGEKFRGAYSGLLLKRWNMPKAQGNAYVYGGIGDNSYHGGGQIDYETRKIYTLYSYNYFKIGDKNFNNSKMRLGYAPYEGGYSELNTWFILEYNTDVESLTPILRFFYKNVLWEVGYDAPRKETNFNIILREFF